MTDNETLLDDALLLVEQNFYFLHMGEFFGKLSKTENFTDRSMFVVKKYENENAFINNFYFYSLFFTRQPFLHDPLHS